jgi:nucleoside-diphosphate-sugar epimerase
MRAFITGAGGFIGGRLAERLRARADEVAGVDLSADPARGIVAGDLTVPGPWRRAAVGSELFLHTAAVVSNVGDPERYWRLNVLGTRLALDAALEAGARRFVHFSSVRAFGDSGWPDGVTEEFPVRPQGRPYVDTKIASEQVVLQAHAAGEIECTVIRPGDVYGPGSRPWVLLPLEMIRAGRFLLPARGRGIFSPVYVDNLIDGVLAAAESDAAAGHVFTISDGVGIETREFFAHHCRMLGAPPPRGVPTALAKLIFEVVGRIERAAGRESEAGAVAADYLARRGTYSIAKAARTLGYAPAVGLEDGMRRTEAWLREQRLLD